MLIHRTLAVCALSGLALSGCRRSPAPIANADREAIHLAVDNFTKAVLAGDFATAASEYAENGMLLPPNAPIVEGRPAIESFFARFGKVTTFNEKFVELEASGDLAYARLTYDLSMTPPGTTARLNDTGKLILIFRKQINGSWLVSRGIWNSDVGIKTVVATTK